MFIPNAYVFITVVTYSRKPLLIDNIEYLRESFKNVLRIYKFEIVATLVNPNQNRRSPSDPATKRSKLPFI